MTTHEYIIGILYFILCEYISTVKQETNDMYIFVS